MNVSHHNHVLIPPTSAPLIHPRFPDTDAKIAPAASPPVEHEVRILKEKILTAYRTHKTGPLNHSREEKVALKRAGQDESIIFKQSDKCKGLVVMPKQMYVQKVHSIVAKYERTPKNTTPKNTNSSFWEKRLICRVFVGLCAREFLYGTWFCH